MNLTTEEKLAKVVEFIKSIEKMSLLIMTTSDIIDSADVYCTECDCAYGIEFNSINDKYVEFSEVEELKDKAWHLLVDIAN